MASFRSWCTSGTAHGLSQLLRPRCGWDLSKVFFFFCSMYLAEKGQRNQKCLSVNYLQNRKDNNSKQKDAQILQCTLVLPAELPISGVSWLVRSGCTRAITNSEPRLTPLRHCASAPCGGRYRHPITGASIQTAALILHAQLRVISRYAEMQCLNSLYLNR